MRQRNPTPAWTCLIRSLHDSRMTSTDRDEIFDVLIRYATAIDTRDWALFRTCFTADCRSDYGDIGSWTDREGITDFMVQAHADLGQTLHRITNPAIAVEGDTATARSYVHMLVPVAAGSTVAFNAFGYYDDELVRAEEGWRIAVRTFTTVVSDDPAILLR
jgi:3-phenylpropionate/cinnamic acid dioxygenase small subunit